MDLVGEHFFDTFSIPVIAGRGFRPTDTETSRMVAVISQEMAKQFFQTPTPSVKHSKRANRAPIRSRSLVYRKTPNITLCERIRARRTIFPYRQNADGEESMTFAVHTRMKPEAIVPVLRDAVASIDKDLPLLDIRTQNEQIEDRTKQERIFASLTGGFGLLALVLACIGIYGIMAYTVSRRTNEIGIRMALGAQSGRVLRMVLREASWLAAIGVVVGLGAAAAMARLIDSMLYGLKTV